MSQFHQVYVIAPQPSYAPKPYKMFGVQMQWGYGWLVLHLLNNLTVLWENMSGDYFPPFANWRTSLNEWVLFNLYSCDPRIGYHSNAITILTDIDDISSLPNNDGITIVDFTGEDVKYCLMALNGLECAEQQFPNLEPMSARDYALCYFPDFETEPDFSSVRKIVTNLSCCPVMQKADVDKWFGYLGLESAKF